MSAGQLPDNPLVWIIAGAFILAGVVALFNAFRDK